MIPYDELCAALERHRLGQAGASDDSPPPPVASAPAYDPHATPIEGGAGEAAGGESDTTGEIDLDSDIVE
jgi:hypothetical protein